MDTIDNIWNASTQKQFLVINELDNAIFISTKLDNGWYKGMLVIPISLGYTVANSCVIVRGDEATWTLV